MKSLPSKVLRQAVLPIKKTYREFVNVRKKPKNLISIPTNLITDEYAFSLASDGWNFFKALIAEYIKNPKIPLEESVFYKFFQHEQLRSACYLQDILFLHDPKERLRTTDHKFYLGEYPWGGWSKSEILAGGNPHGHYYDEIEGKDTRDLWGYGRNPFYDPSDPYPLLVEWVVTTQLYYSILKGYQPTRYGKYPGATLLIREDGEVRAVMGNGHHRMSILSYLGYEQIEVCLPTNWSGKIWESEVDNWYYVKRGICSKEQALEIFHAFFELNGTERINYMGYASSC